MATQTQLKCPECGAKLRLAESPAADEEIECPKCGTVFTPFGGVSAADDAPPEPNPLPVKRIPKEKKPKGPRKRRAKVKKTNPYFLATLLGGAFILLAALGVMFYWLANKAGKVQEILTYVPAECNLVRGVNCAQIRKYPGYAKEVDKIFTEDIRSGAQEMATAAGIGVDEMSSYLVVARSRKGGNTATVYLFRASEDVDGVKLGTGLGGSAQQQDGQTVYRIASAAGGNILSGAVVFPATKRVIVVVAAGPRQADMLRGVVAGKTAAKEDTFYGKVGSTGEKVSVGNIWLLVRTTDDLKQYAADLPGDGFADAFGAVAEEMNKTPVFGMWTSYGQVIRYGLALQASSPERAKELVKGMEDGPLGKKDDAEIPNGLRKAYSQSTSKEFREFLANLSFRTSGDCAMITSKMSNQMAARVADLINGVNVGVNWTPLKR